MEGTKDLPLTPLGVEELERDSDAVAEEGIPAPSRHIEHADKQKPAVSLAAERSGPQEPAGGLLLGRGGEHERAIARPVKRKPKHRDRVEVQDDGVVFLDALREQIRV